MNIKPLFDRVLLKSICDGVKSPSGLFLPSSLEEKPELAEVVAVGSGMLFDGKTAEMQIKVGDIVVFSKFAGTECKIEDNNYILIRQTDVLAIVNNKGEK